MIRGKYYRLNPHMDKVKIRSSMFQLRDLAQTQLITGEYWGNDYLVAPTNEEDCKALEELMNGEGIYYEVVNKLPYTHFSYEV